MIQKTKVLTLLVFGLLFLNLSAQEDEYSSDKVAKLPDDNRKVRFGLQFNPNISWLKANTAGYKNEGTDFGFSYGLTVEYFMTKNYLFSSGINLLKVGGVLSFPSVFRFVSNGDISSTPANLLESYTIKYVEIPLVLKLRTNEIGYLSYFGQFGLNAGINYKANAQYEYFDVTTSELIFSAESADITNEINWLNLALVVGAGLEYNISGNTSVAVGLTYNNGFINQLDTKVFELDLNGNALLDTDGKPVLSSKNASANMNYVALNIVAFF